MATLQKIRNKGGLLVAIVIGLALLAFILGDFMNKGSAGSQYTTEIGEIAGEPVPYVNFRTKYEEALENTRQNSNNTSIDDNTHQRIRDQIWQQLVRSYVMEEEYDELGISVSNEEVFDMVQGENIHPQVKRLFANPETGAVDQSEILQILKSIHEDGNVQRKIQWKRIEEELINQRMYEKYMNLISKGLSITSQQAKAEFYNTNHKVNFSFISQNYDVIPDSTITISEKEIEDYYKANIEKYQQEASRKLEYVAFDVRASADDDKATKESINELKDDFENETEIAQFVNLESDTPFDTRYYKEGGQNPIINENLFNGKIGDSFGPYFENGTYKLIRLSDIKYMPDSVRARHILIEPKAQTAEAMENAKSFADSLKDVIERGGNFADLARTHSLDRGSGAKGGNLGWFQENTMVPPFNDACFFGKKGDLVLVESQFGQHIIEILEQGRKQKRIQVAVLERKVTPSDETQHSIFTKASEFAGVNNTSEKFQSAITEQGLRNVPIDLKETDRFIYGLESPRALVLWAFNKNTEEKDISEVYTFGDKFVVACVSKVKEKGDKSLEDAKFEIEVILKKEKKASILAEKINAIAKEGKDFEQIAASLETEVKNAENISFNSTTIVGTGNEPNLIATAVSLAKDQISEPIKGDIGVYLIKVSSESDLEATDYDLEKSKLKNAVSSRVYYEAFEALKKNANIQDNRAKFY